MVVVTLGVHMAVERGGAPPALLSRIYDDVVAQLQRASAGVMMGRANSGGGGGRRDPEGETGKAELRVVRIAGAGRSTSSLASYHAGRPCGRARR